MVWFGFLQLALFFTSAIHMPLQNLPLKLLMKFAPYVFWWEMNRLVGMLLFNSPYSCEWFDQASVLMGVSAPILSLYYIPKIAWLKIMKGYDFFFLRNDHIQKGKDLTKDVLTRPLLPNQPHKWEMSCCMPQRRVQIHPITSDFMSSLL